MSDKVRVDPEELHTAGDAVTAHASHLRDGTGGIRLALSNATDAAAHPNAQAAIDSFRQHAETQLAYWAEAIGAFAQGLHQAADRYAGADDSSAQTMSD